jgi:hypothetical protein
LARRSISRASASIFAVEVGDQAQQRLKPRARVGAQLELVQEAQAAGAEQVGVAGQHRHADCRRRVQGRDAQDGVAIGRPGGQHQRP